MQAVDSRPRLAEQSRPDATGGLAVPIGEDELVTLPLSDLFVGVNADPSSQTRPILADGDSAPQHFLGVEWVVIPPELHAPAERFIVLQKWQGYVTGRAETTFRARLEPLTGEGPEQVAEIYVNEVDEQDQTLIEPGAVFYWTVGYHDKPSGRERTSIIRFRRLPTWSAHEIDAAARDAEQLRRLLGAD